MNRFILFLSLIFFAQGGLACLQLARTVALSNSPFFFDHFEVHGTYFAVPFSGGQQTVKLSCDHDANNNHLSYIEATDDAATPEPDAMERTALHDYFLDENGQPVLGDNGQPLRTQFYDTAEVPQRTTFTAFRNQHDQSSFEVRSQGSPNYLRVSCRLRGLDSQVVVSFMGPDGEIASVGATHRGGTRSIGMKTSPDATVDMNNLTAGNVNFPGCGGYNLPEDQGTGTGQPVRN